MAETNAASPFNWMIMVVWSIPISMTFHSLYIILLIGLMGKDVPLSKRPINILLLIDELLRLVGSAGTLIAAILATIWREAEVANSKICRLTRVCKLVKRSWKQFHLTFSNEYLN